MAGKHLRRAHGPDLRLVAVGSVALAAGVLIGAGGAVALDGPDEVVARTEVAGDAVVGDDTTTTGGTAAPTTDGGSPGTATMAPDPTMADGPITLAFVGDVNTEYGLGDRLAQDRDGFVGPFAGVLHDADLVVANVEAAIATGGRALDKQWVFRSPPAVLDGLAAGGVDLVSVANNHAMDFGEDGLAETLAAREAATGAALIGIGADEDDAYAPAIRTIGGRTVAVLAATQVLDGDRIASWSAGPDQAGIASAKRVDRLVEAVRRADDQADVVVVYLHWGVETEECPSADQQTLAAALVEAGADVVTGTHAHRVQGGGWLGDAVVHYGLGNFLFGAPSEASARTGVLLVDVDDDGPTGYRWLPGRIRTSVPEPLDGDDAAAASARWESLRACTDLTP